MSARAVCGCGGEAARCLEERIAAELAAAPCLADVARHAVQGGRRLRARLLLDGCAPLTEPALQAAVALEMLHGATLIQDDILDHGSQRHGTACTYLQFGAARALLSSDWLLVRALDLASEVDLRFLRAMNRVVREMICTETLDLEPGPEGTRTGAAVSTILQTAAGKTGGLFGLALYGAALLRGRSTEQAEAAQRLGVELGTTYQLLDDARDVYMTEEEAGKGVCRDLAAGHLTMPILFAMQHLAMPGTCNDAAEPRLSYQQLRRQLAAASAAEKNALLAAAQAEDVRLRLNRWLGERLDAHRRDALALALLPAVTAWESRIDALLETCCGKEMCCMHRASPTPRVRTEYPHGSAMTCGG